MGNHNGLQKNKSSVLVHIIDDDKIIRSMLTKVLLKSGYQVVSSDNGIDGIKQYKKKKPDIILLDVLMPDMDGYEVCSELRKLENDQALPILMLTGLNDVESVNEAFRVGATDFVTKPINLALLGQRVKYALKGKDMYHEIQRKSNELSAILSSASDSIITTDLNDIILQVNPATENLFKADKEQLINKHVFELIPDLKNSAKIGHKEIQLTGLRLNRENFPLELSVNTVDTKGISFKCYFIRDLTERVKIEHMKVEFIQTVSHELRTPIAAIKGAVGLLGGGILGEFPPDVQELINIPQRACNKLEELVDDILDINTLEDPSETLNYEIIQVDDLLDKVVNEYRDTAADQNIEIIVTHYPELFLKTNLKRISKALAHLLSNAIKFSPKGGTVTLTAWEENTFVTLAVSDNGPGISSNDCEKIFDKFTQIDNSSTRHQGGTGLGLYIAKMAVEKLWGHIKVESTIGKGSTFTIIIPKEH